MPCSPTKNKFICNWVKAMLGDKAVQNTFSCAFPIFRDLFQNLRICLRNEFFLGRRNLRRPRTIPFLGPENMPVPKTKFLLGRRNLRRPRRNFSLWKIQSFWKLLQKIGNAQLNIFCTALSHNFMVDPSSPYQSWLYHIFFFILGGGVAQVRLGWVRLDDLT